MNDKAVSRIHWSFWLIAVAALVWNIMGAMNYVMQMNPDALIEYPETHRTIIDGRPAWATAGFAIAVFGGALGCLLLLFRKSAALYLFIASLLGVLLTMIHTLRVVASNGGFSPFEITMMVVMPPMVAAFLVWYARWAGGKGWVA